MTVAINKEWIVSVLLRVGWSSSLIKPWAALACYLQNFL